MDRTSVPSLPAFSCGCWAFTLAEAGLLDGHRATTHWAFADRLAREFPAVTVDPEPIFVRSAPTVWTAAGVTAGTASTI